LEGASQACGCICNCGAPTKIANLQQVLAGAQQVVQLDVAMDEAKIVHHAQAK
jgi:hypothetical protein